MHNEERLKASNYKAPHSAKFPIEIQLSDEATDVEIQMYEDCDDQFELYDCTDQVQITDKDDDSADAGPQNLTEFLEQVITDPFNHYCLNCKQNLSSHVIMQLGVFICSSCSDYFTSQCGGPNGECCSIKSVFGEQEWADDEIRTIQVGGNKPVFELLLNNRMEQVPVIVNYNHPVMQQYKKQHLMRVKGIASSYDSKKQLMMKMEVRKKQLNNKVEKIAESFSDKQDKFVDGMHSWWEFASKKVTSHLQQKLKKQNSAHI